MDTISTAIIPNCRWRYGMGKQLHGIPLSWDNIRLKYLFGWQNICQIDT